MKTNDTDSAVGIIKALYSQGTEAILPGVSRIRQGHLDAAKPPAGADDVDLSALSDEALNNVIKQGREHLPPCPNADDYKALGLTRRACLERARRLARLRGGKAFTASPPGNITE